MEGTSSLRMMKFMIVLIVWVFCKIFLGEFMHMVCWQSNLCYNLVETVDFVCIYYNHLEKVGGDA